MSNGESHNAVDELVDMWFHSKAEDGCIKWQGHVVSSLGDGWYLVQLLSWFSGGTTCLKVVHLAAMTEWDFYGTGDDMRDAYEVRG